MYVSIVLLKVMILVFICKFKLPGAYLNMCMETHIDIKLQSSKYHKCHHLHFAMKPRPCILSQNTRFQATAPFLMGLHGSAFSRYWLSTQCMLGIAPEQETTQMKEPWT